MKNGLSDSKDSALFWTAIRSLAVWTGNSAMAIFAAGSTGRCNTGVKSFRWGVEPQSFKWPFVGLARHFVQMHLRIRRRVGSLRKILSEQTGGVLVGGAAVGTSLIAMT
jgi:hypothetical protein